MAQKRILMVDDNLTNLKLAGFMLAAYDYEMKTAASACEAFALLASFKPDLLLLDLQLPDEDGLSLARRLKSDPTTSYIPIIAVTAYAMKGDEEKARAAGVSEYITKPINKEMLRAAVTACLTRGERP